MRDYVVMPVKVERSFTFSVTRGHTISRWRTGFWRGYFDNSGLKADLFELLRDHFGASRVLVARRVLAWNRDQLACEIDHLGLRSVDRVEQACVMAGHEPILPE